MGNSPSSKKDSKNELSLLTKENERLQNNQLKYEEQIRVLKEKNLKRDTKNKGFVLFKN